MKFLIITFQYDWRSGGVMALNLLAKMLREQGHEVTGVGTARSPHFNVVLFQDAHKIAQRDDVWTIYPEVISGNPLNAKNVVRWVMYYSGVQGGDKEYDDSEVVMTYHDTFVQGTKYEGAPILHIRDSQANVFQDLGMQRTIDGILIKKGHATFEQRKQKYVMPYAEQLLNVVVVDDELQRIADMQQLNLLYNRMRYFISFDCETYHSVMAAMAGCTSIIVPQDGVTKDQIIEDFKYGIAYGFNDIPQAEQTRHLVHDYARRMEDDNQASIERLLKAIQ
jgi:hypothetical protein